MSKATAMRELPCQLANWVQIKPHASPGGKGNWLLTPEVTPTATATPLISRYQVTGADIKTASSIPHFIESAVHVLSGFAVSAVKPFS
jgi:hypothetical protein